MRNLKCSLSAAEFGAMRWAAARSGPPGQPAQSLADFMRAALRERAQAVAERESAAGRSVPPGIVATLAEWDEDGG